MSDSLGDESSYTLECTPPPGDIHLGILMSTLSTLPAGEVHAAWMRDEKLYNLLSITGDATRHINLDSPGYLALQPLTL